jgi:hypothetical protein
MWQNGVLEKVSFGKVPKKRDELKNKGVVGLEQASGGGREAGRKDSRLGYYYDGVHLAKPRAKSGIHPTDVCCALGSKLYGDRDSVMITMCPCPLRAWSCGEMEKSMSIQQVSKDRGRRRTVADGGAFRNHRMET